MPAEERIRNGNVIYRTRMRDVEDTIAQLLHDEDQSIASAAILLVEEKGLWSLAGDLEAIRELPSAFQALIEQAAEYVKQMKKDKRYQRDVY